MGTEKERKDTQQAIIYELRRLISKNKDGKDSYTVDELCELLDTIAEAKAQEQLSLLLFGGAGAWGRPHKAKMEMKQRSRFLW